MKFTLAFLAFLCIGNSASRHTPLEIREGQLLYNCGLLHRVAKALPEYPHLAKEFHEGCDNTLREFGLSEDGSIQTERRDGELASY